MSTKTGKLLIPCRAVAGIAASAALTLGLGAIVATPSGAGNPPTGQPHHPAKQHHQPPWLTAVRGFSNVPGSDFGGQYYLAQMGLLCNRLNGDLVYYDLRDRTTAIHNNGCNSSGTIKTTFTTQPKHWLVKVKGATAVPGSDLGGQYYSDHMELLCNVLNGDLLYYSEDVKSVTVDPNGCSSTGKVVPPPATASATNQVVQ